MLLVTSLAAARVEAHFQHEKKNTYNLLFFRYKAVEQKHERDESFSLF